jgi:hypothetical protein
MLRPQARLLVGHERGDARARTRRDADEQADERGPDDVPPLLQRQAQPFKRVGPARPHRALAPRLVDDHLLLDHHQRLGDCEQADQRRHQGHAVVELEKAEGGARRVVDMVGTDHADQQAEEACDQRLDGILAGDHGDQRQAEEHHDHHFHRAQVQADLREPRQQRDGGERSDQPAEHGGSEAEHQRLLRLALLRHRVAVERSGRRAARAGDLHQDRRDAAGEVVRAIEGDHERHCLLHRHCEGERQQHDEGVLRAEAGQDADHDAQQDRRQDDPPQPELRCELAEQELPGQESNLSIGPCGMSDCSRATNNR